MKEVITYNLRGISDNSNEYYFVIRQFTREVLEWVYRGDYLRHNIICRQVSDSEGSLIADEYVTENHAIMMYTPFLQAAPESLNISK